MTFSRYGFSVGAISVTWWDLWASMKLDRAGVPWYRSIRQRMGSPPIEIIWRPRRRPQS